MAKRKRQSIPLSAIPAKPGKRRIHPEEVKRRAVAALAESGANLSAVAREFTVSESMLRNWQKAFDPLLEVRKELDQAARERAKRLETAALLVEADGSTAARQLGNRIRALVNGAAPMAHTPRNKR